LIEELFETNVVAIEKAISMMYCLFQQDFSNFGQFELFVEHFNGQNLIC
jgi:hypothetical protein